MPDEHEQQHHHHGKGGGRTLGDYARDFLSNWDDDDSPLGRKLWLTVRNRARAYGPPFKGCCGHRGEPGC